MLILLSPAKKLDEPRLSASPHFSQPRFLDAAEQLVEQLRTYPPQQLASLMQLSDPLAALNAVRYAQWQRPFTPENARIAVHSFNGDVYAGLDAAHLSVETLDYAQRHLRILSGLYGVLRPLDLMQAYRLEMGTALVTPAGRDLYAFWGSRITEQLNADWEQAGAGLVVNLASVEYFKAVRVKQLHGEVITPLFKDWSKGQYKMISFFAKRARGLMARYLLEQQVSTLSAVLDFQAEGYAYHPELTTHPSSPVFSRKVDA